MGIPVTNADRQFAHFHHVLHFTRKVILDHSTYVRTVQTKIQRMHCLQEPKINNNNSSNFRGNAFSFKRYSAWRKKKCGLFNLLTENNFCQENADGRYPDMYNCCKFIRCSNGIPRQRSCPLGLMFNRTRKTCDWPENVLCQGQHATVHETVFKPSQFRSKEVST